MPAANHQDIQSFITMATAFSQMSYQGVYLFDFTTSRFLYASNHPLLLGKASIDDFYNKGIDVFQTIAALCVVTVLSFNTLNSARDT